MENALCWSQHFIYIDEQWLIAEVAQQCNEFLSKAFPQEKKLELLQIAFLVPTLTIVGKVIFSYASSSTLYPRQ